MLDQLLEKDRVLRISLLTALVFYGGVLATTVLSQDLVNIMGQHVGGDFMAFYAAGSAFWQGDALASYDVAWFENQLQEIGPAVDYYGLTWQYPPTYFLFVAPFALLPYKLACLAWFGASLGFFAWVLRQLPIRRFGLIIALTSPFLLTAAMQGQNSFFFGGLLILAATLAGTRPVLAGVAAGLLTMKPQLGLLIPFAFAAAGCWRAFGTAAVTGLALAGISLLIFGLEGWSAFADSLGRVHGDLEAGGVLYPYARMISLYSALGMLGVPHLPAMIMHWAFAAGLICLVVLIWRRCDDLLLRGGVLCAASILVPPYAYYYEMTALVLPLAAMLTLTAASQQTTARKLFLVLGWPAVLLLPTIQPALPLQLGFCVSLLTLAFTASSATGKLWSGVQPDRGITPDMHPAKTAVLAKN